MVARVVSEHVVELNVVNFVGGLGLEPLEDDCHLFFGHLHAEVVED